MVFGSTEIDAVGAGGGGGGGGGGGAAFFLQAPSIMTALKASTSVNHFMRWCFTFDPPATPMIAFSRSDEVCIYFQLQFGCVLRPVNVNCRALVPSASIIQISSLP